MTARTRRTTLVCGIVATALLVGGVGCAATPPAAPAQSPQAVQLDDVSS